MIFITIIIIALILLVVLLIFWFKFVKVPKLNNLNFISGAIGTGKSLLTCDMTIQKFWIRVKLQNLVRLLVYRNLIFIPKLKDKIVKAEDINYYSVIPNDLTRLHLKHFDLFESIKQHKKVYVPITWSFRLEKEHFLREKRLTNKCVCNVDEISVFFDQFDFDDKIINEKLNNFFKLFRHETKGGIMVVNSQSINDCHFALKNCLSQYFYIHHKKKLLFGMLLYLQELQYSNDNNVINVNQGDLEDNMKLKVLWVSKKLFKVYDTYAHSWLTDNCPTFNIPYSMEYNKKSRNLWTLKLISSLYDNVPKDLLSQEQIEYVLKSDMYKKSYLYRKYKELKKIEKERDSYEQEKVS